MDNKCCKTCKHWKQNEHTPYEDRRRCAAHTWEITRHSDKTVNAWNYFTLPNALCYPCLWETRTRPKRRKK